MKRGALSKIELSYIENNRTLPVEELAKELDRSSNFIQKCVDALPVVQEEKKEEYTPMAVQSKKPEEYITNVPRGQFDKAMGKTDADKERRKKAAIMLPNASMVSDDFKKTLRKPQSPHVFKCKEE